MWAMADIDGRDLARSFYELVFSYETKGGNYYERMAEARREETAGKGKDNLERRVSFIVVHISQMSVRGLFQSCFVKHPFYTTVVALICSDTQQTPHYSI